MNNFKRESIEDYVNNEKWFNLHKNADAIRYDSLTKMPIEAVYFSPWKLQQMPAPGGAIPDDDETLSGKMRGEG